ncbi:MAG: type II toxin-antitoxin system RelE/ParE family toxin [Candidatus Aureabacteria bacterium]|nr:type II toxin-antitoxin system RelE/ParE family toxin [Candidatus Auribacterota bacterium]
MVKITPSKRFIKNIKNLDKSEREKLKKQIKKIIENYQVGKPLKYKRGERSLYIKPFRLIYAVRGDEIILLKFDHRKRVYGR